MSQEQQLNLLKNGKYLFDSIAENFSKIIDPRVADNQTYSLAQLIFCVFIGSLAGCNNLNEIHTYLHAKKDFICETLSMDTIPSKHTLWILLVLLDPNAFEQSFFNWVDGIAKTCGGELIAIDGKALRGTCEKGRPNSYLHVVHALGCHSKLLLGQVATDKKSNEITAIPKLLQALEVKKSIITIDAAGCQKRIAKDIIKREGNYILALKGNQGLLHKDVELYFTGLTKEKREELDNDSDYDKGHGRVEKRSIYIETNIDWLLEYHHWEGLSAIIMVESVRILKGEETKESRFYISSLKKPAKKMLECIRGHWEVESFHWSLDVIFNEDQITAKQGHIAENLALIRRWVLNLVRMAGPKKMGLKEKRQTAGWNNQFLLQILREGFCKEIFTK